MLKTLAIAGIFSLAFNCCAFAHDCGGGRMERSVSNSAVSNSGGFQADFSPTKHFAAWKKEFVNPTACRMNLCHGGCAASGNGCTLQHKKCDSAAEHSCK